MFSLQYWNLDLPVTARNSQYSPKACLGQMEGKLCLPNAICIDFHAKAMESLEG